VSRLLSICKGIGEGLNHLLKEKIVHRDLKLDNILIDENDCPIICDFGMAAKLEENLTLRIFDLDLSGPGGNKSHLAPEVLNSYYLQKREKKREIVIDYSKQPSFEFGVICYEILCGLTHPFQDYPPQLINLYPIEINFNTTFMDSLEKIPNEIKDLISLLLKNDPNERPLIEEIIDNF